MINLKNFESNLSKINKKHYKGIHIYYIGFWKYDDCENIHSANPSYFVINQASGILKKKMKYLIFDDSADERKKLIKKYAEVWDGLKNEVKAINGGELQKRLHKK